MWCASLLLLSLLLVPAGDALRHGDHVVLSKRTQFNEMRTEWTPVLREFAPRFSEETSVELPALKPALLAEGTDLKMSFGFEHEQFKTPWILFATGSGRFLDRIDFTITYSGDHITGLKWRTEYNDEPQHHDQWPEIVVLEFHWVELNPQDVKLGLNMLFFVGFALTFAVLVAAALSSRWLFDETREVVVVSRDHPAMAGKGKSKSG